MSIKVKILILACHLCLSDTFASDRVALVVGVDRYDHLPANQQLRIAVRDASLMADTLRNASPAFDVTLLADVSQDDVEESLETFISKAKNADCALIYFACHGVEFHGENYLLVRDTSISEVSGDVRRMKRRLGNEGVSLQSILDDLEVTQANLKLVILDCCRDNPLEATSESGTRSIVGSKGGLAQAIPPSGTLISYSADAGETAIDGLFTEVLVKNIKKPGVPVMSALAATRKEVRETSQQLAIDNILLSAHEPAEYSKLDPAGLKFTFVVAPKNQGTLPGSRGDAENLAMRQRLSKLEEELASRNAMEEEFNLLKEENAKLRNSSLNTGIGTFPSLLGLDQNHSEANAGNEELRKFSKRSVAILARADWKSLFSGDNLSEWHPNDSGFTVSDGVISTGTTRSSLRSKEVYTDFAFRTEFKLEESAKGGIGIRVAKNMDSESGGIEFKMIDHNGSQYRGDVRGSDTKSGSGILLRPEQMHGSVSGLIPAKTGFLKPSGEWNEQTIVAIEDHLMVILNGVVILDTFLDDSLPVSSIKIYGLNTRIGSISLIGKGDHVEFRNLEIADLSASPPIPLSTSDNEPPPGFTALFNGRDLTGWKGLADKSAPVRRALSGSDLQEAQSTADEIMKEHWSAVEGILTYDGSGQSLCTAKDYGDFELYIDWKIPPDADTGIYLRGTPQIQMWNPWDTRTNDKPDPANSEEWVAAYKNGRNLGSGGLWNNRRTSNRPLVLADNKPGEWNTFLIRMVGEKVSIWLNEKLVVDRTRLENYWDREGDRTAPLPRADQIELQHHGSPLFFKNVYMRELPY